MASQHPIIAASAKYPKPAERTFQYGTAGVGPPSKAIKKIHPRLADLMLI